MNAENNCLILRYPRLEINAKMPLCSLGPNLSIGSVSYRAASLINMIRVPRGFISFLFWRMIYVLFANGLVLIHPSVRPCVCPSKCSFVRIYSYRISSKITCKDLFRINRARGGSRISVKGVRMFKGMGVRFAEVINFS